MPGAAAVGPLTDAFRKRTPGAIRCYAGMAGTTSHSMPRGSARRSGAAARPCQTGVRSTGIHSSASACVASGDRRVRRISGPGRLW